MDVVDIWRMTIWLFVLSWMPQNIGLSYGQLF